MTNFNSRTDGLSRRGVLGVLGLGAAAAMLPGRSFAAPDAKHGTLRIAHLTDIHIQPELAAAEGLAECLKHVQGQAGKPELIVTGGDLIMDSFDADEARTKLQWELLTKTFREHCSMPVRHTLGNHDIWGWNKSKSKTTGKEAGWGKQRAVNVLGLEKPYYSFDKGHWHVVILDSVAVDPNDPNGYIGALGEEQLAWLKGDLAAAKDKHTLVVSHIPILTITALEAPDKKNQRTVSGGLMLVDSEAVRGVLEKAGNVRACLSGHMHRLDRVEFRGISYCCNGAVCGAWWKGPHQEANEGYTLVDLHEDGKVECAYTTYGWKARA